MGRMMINFDSEALDFFVWKDFPVIFDSAGDKGPEAWVNIHGHWGRISVESIAFACSWISREAFLKQFGTLPPLPPEAFRSRRMMAA
jgi:hypothetical protein